MRDKAEGRDPEAAGLAETLRDSVREVVQRQVDAGIDIVSDGEFSKPSYATYVSERLSGFGGKGALKAAADLADYRSYAAHLVKIGGVIPSGYGSCCQGPVAV